MMSANVGHKNKQDKVFVKNKVVFFNRLWNYRLKNQFLIGIIY